MRTFATQIQVSSEADGERAARSLSESTVLGQIKSLPWDQDCVRVVLEGLDEPPLDFGRVFPGLRELPEFDQAALVLSRIVDTWQSESIHIALVLVFKELDALMRAGDFDGCDETLRRACSTFEEYEETELSDSVQLMIGMLTATLPIASKLDSRSEFLRQVGSRLGDLGLSREEVLAGL